MVSRRRVWFLIRVTIYLAVIGGLILWRGGVDWRRLLHGLRGAPAETGVVSVSGRALAPDLIDRLVEFYRRDYPGVVVELSGGGTNQALEDLFNDRADVAFLYRSPSAAEQALFRELKGDSIVVFPVAVAGAVLLAGSDAPADGLTVAQLREALEGTRSPPWAHLYVPDANEGLWDAVRARLGVADRYLPALANVVFLKDPAAVLEAVARDPEAWGLASTFVIATDSLGVPTVSARIVRLRTDDSAPPVLPTRENVAAGAYPLYHELLVSCVASGDLAGAKFVTQLASARGQRQVERAGALPARQVAREVYLTREPVAERP
jgi:ABC-type phosphate transport system substrate-binding protein